MKLGKLLSALLVILILGTACVKQDNHPQEVTWPNYSQTTTAEITEQITTTEDTTTATTEITAETTAESTTVTTEETTEITESTTVPTTVATEQTTVTTSKVSNASSDFDGHSGFIRASGTKLVDKNGKSYVIKAINFGNLAMDYPSNANTYTLGRHHTEESYKEIAEMGFNSVRFLLNYNLFEDDTNPYVYKESGFDWLDKNIEWAKKYGIRLVLDMHAPQGGYQSWDRVKYRFDGLDEGDALWINQEYQKRLVAMWGEIAKRYANEPAILGYCFVNEPVIAANEINYNNINSQGYKDALKLYKKLLEDATAAVRKTDKNHIIFVQRVCAFKDTDMSWANWVTANDTYNFILLNDSNVAYEFHFYGPYNFSHQEVGATGKDTVYGTGSGAEFSNFKAYASTEQGRADTKISDWQYVESEIIKVTNSSWNTLALTFQANKLDFDGEAYIDSVVIKEFDEQGNFVKQVYTDSFETSEWLDYDYVDEHRLGNHEMSNIAYSGKQSLCIKASLNEGSVTKFILKTENNHSYQVSAYVKLVNCTENANVMPRLDLGKSKIVKNVGPNNILGTIQTYMAFAKKYKVPIFCGEYGLKNICYYENADGVNRGGAEWVNDVLGFLIENNIGSAYHSYYGGLEDKNDFGMYQTYGKIQVGSSQRDARVYNALKDTLSKYK